MVLEGDEGGSFQLRLVSFRMRETRRKRTFARGRFRTRGSGLSAYRITTSGLERVLEYEARLFLASPHLGRQNVTGQCYAQSSRGLDGWYLQARYTFKSKLELKKVQRQVGVQNIRLEAWY
jgi:hypothetical protein